MRVGQVGGGMECQPEQPPLALRFGEFGDVEHDIARRITHGDHSTWTFDHVERVVTVPDGHLDRLVERAHVAEHCARLRERACVGWRGRRVGSRSCRRNARWRQGVGTRRWRARRRGRALTERRLVAVGSAGAQQDRSDRGSGERGSLHRPSCTASVAIQFVRRVSPSWTTLTASFPSLVKIEPRASPRADDVETASWA